MISWKLGIKTSLTISYDDVEEIKGLLDVNSYNNLRQEQKEEQIFSMVYTAFISENKAEKMIKYLIFDYNIKESIALKAVTHNINPEGISPEVQKMFDSRNLNKELNNALSTSKNNVQKRKKI